jgi:hypothetical protein
VDCIVESDLPDGNVCTPYSATLTASPGITLDPGNNMVWSIGSGALPDGLSLSAGNITGTPTVSGSFNFEVCLDQVGGS